MRHKAKLLLRTLGTITFLLSIAIDATIAQQTIFDVPSHDVTPEGHVIGEAYLSYRTN
jgi:hypothetical protein